MPSYIFVAYRDSGFMAVRTSFVQLANVASTNLVFDQAIYNELNLYDTTTGVYTVAFDAYYLIHVQIYSTHIPDFRILVCFIHVHIIPFSWRSP